MEKINKTAFGGGKDHIVGVSLGAGTLEIKGGAFKNFSNLTAIFLPSTLTKIGSSAFRNCTSLTSADIPAGVIEIGNNAYRGSGIESVSFSGTALKSVGGSAFRSCKKLRRVSFPDGLEQLGGSALRDCESLESVTIPKSVQSMGSFMFADCTGLKSITVPFVGKNRDSSRTAGWYWFGSIFHETPSSGLKVAVTDALTIKKKAFEDCSYLSEISLNDGITEIGKDAFGGCYNLLTVRLPYSLSEYADEFPRGAEIEYYN